MRIAVGADHAGFELAREVPWAFVWARASADERHRRRLERVNVLEARLGAAGE